MTPFPSIASPRRHDRGGVSWVTALLLVLLASAAYLAVAWYPVYVVHYAARQTVREFMNQAIKNKDDAQLVANLCAKLKTLATVPAVAADGREEEIPAINVDPQDVIWERDTGAQPPTLRVSFEYTREVQFPYLASMNREWVGSIDMESDISVVNWGPLR
jgi:hypothetical protein